MYYTRKVAEDLYWIGADDRRTHLFENIHPIPEGVSYNSYLLMDEQTVLMDTIDWSCCRQMMENLEHLLGDRPLDYIVMHHLEPDHAASLQVVLDRWPNVKLIGSAMAFRFMEQFGFQAEGHERIIKKDGDTHCFGKHTLTYLTAPMVHWPEVLVSLDSYNGVLFTADAFGTFGALNGRLFNDESDFDAEYMEHARRYYINIVGKYGEQVQDLLKKAGPVMDQVKMICPLHGPIWRNNLGHFIEKHDYWSKWKPEEKGVLIAYASMYGDTEAAADALAGKLVERDITNITMCDVSTTHVSYLMSHLARLSHLVLASVTYNMGIYPPMLGFMHDMQALKAAHRTVALMECGTWAPAAGRLIKAELEKMDDMKLLEPMVTMKSSMPGDRAAELDSLADTIAASVNAYTL